MKKRQTKRTKTRLGIACILALLLSIGSADAFRLTGKAAELGENAAPVDAAATAPADSPVGVPDAAVPQPDAPAAPNSVTISLAGDCALGDLAGFAYAGTVTEAFDLFGPSYFFKNVKDIFASDDMTLVNLEGVLSTSNKRVEKKFNIKGRPEFNKILVEGSVEAVSFGNNHNMDYGMESMIDTINAVTEVGIPFAVNDLCGIYATKSGVRIGFVSVNEVYEKTHVETYLQKGIGWLKEQQVDLILACCHWGIERDPYPEAYQKTLARKCIDWGADLVVGCHPHILQGLEKYNGKYIIYSLGNFCFGANKNPQDKDTMIVQATFPIADGAVSGDAQLKVIPCTISSVQTRNDYCPTVAAPAKAAAIIQRLNTYSKPFGITVDPAGNVSQ